MRNLIKIGTEENYVEVKDCMSFYEKKEYQNCFGGIFTTDKKVSKIEINTKKKFEETEDYFLLQSQVKTIVEYGKVMFDYNDVSQRKTFDRVLKECYGETSKNLEEAITKIKELNELVKDKEGDEEEKND